MRTSLMPDQVPRAVAGHCDRLCPRKCAMRHGPVVALRVLCAVALALIPTRSLLPQIIMQRTPELERLQAFVGEWRRESRGEEGGRRAGPDSVRVVKQWGPGDTWMTWEMSGVFPSGVPIAGRRMIVYDAAADVYRSVWVDTQSAAIIDATCRWLDDATFEIVGEPIDWSDGHRYQFRTVMRFVSPEEIEEIGWRALDRGPFRESHRVTLRRNPDRSP